MECYEKYNWKIKNKIDKFSNYIFNVKLKC